MNAHIGEVSWIDPNVFCKSDRVSTKRFGLGTVMGHDSYGRVIIAIDEPERWAFYEGHGRL